MLEVGWWGSLRDLSKGSTFERNRPPEKQHRRGKRVRIYVCVIGRNICAVVPVSSSAISL